MHLDAQSVDLIAKPIRVPAHLALHRNGTAREHGAAQFPRLFEQRDFVPPQPGPTRCFHPRWSAADDGHSTGLTSRVDVEKPLVAYGGVNGASHVAFDHERFLPAADEAGDTAANFFGLAVSSLVGPVRIGDQLA